MNTGELIRKYRKAKKMTMKELGKIVGVSEQAISQYERGLRNVNLETLIKISNALNVSVNTLSEKQSTVSQEILKNEFIDKGVSLDDIAKESGVPICEIKSLYENSNLHTMDTYFKLFKYLGLDDEYIMKIIVEDSRIDCIYNNDGTDPIKNKLKKFYLGEPLDTNDLLLGMEDSDDTEFINYLFQMGQLYNNQDIYTKLTENIFENFGYKICTSSDDLISIQSKKNNEVIAKMHPEEFEKITDSIKLTNEAIVSKVLKDFKVNR